MKTYTVILLFMKKLRVTLYMSLSNMFKINLKLNIILLYLDVIPKKMKTKY